MPPPMVLDKDRGEGLLRGTTYTVKMLANRRDPTSDKDEIVER